MKSDEGGYRSRFSHDEEIATPGYYAVTLKDYNIKAELTVTNRTGYHKYTFPESASSRIMIDMKHGIRDSCTGAMVKIVNDREIEGYRMSIGFVKKQTVYFCAQFSKPFKSFGTWKGNDINQGSSEESGYGIGAFVNYNTEENESVEIKVGMSYTSIDQARLNLQAESSGWQFDKIRDQAKRTWNDELGRIKVAFTKGINDPYRKDKMITFYTALYHSLLFRHFLQMLTENTSGSMIRSTRKMTSLITVIFHCGILSVQKCRF
ncbi:MAG: glycoside hydrolase family 92 protein [Bacteroidales bacterium]|nr:glycoside hydrolase family 92 protein [Bacteroidales bacterium]